MNPFDDQSLIIYFLSYNMRNHPQGIVPYGSQCTRLSSGHTPQIHHQYVNNLPSSYNGTRFFTGAKKVLQTKGKFCSLQGNPQFDILWRTKPNHPTPPPPTPPQIHNPLEPVSSIPTSNTPIILSQLLSQSFLNPHSHHIPFQILTPFRPQPPRFIEETAISIQKMGSAGYRKRPDGREGC